MPLPKRRFSRSRRDKRRTQIHLKAASVTKCSQCASPLVTHQICTVCGYYRGRAVVAVKTKKSA